MVCPTCILLKAALDSLGVSGSSQIVSAVEPVLMATETKVKGKVSRYNREYKKQFASLKKKHPRTSFHTLVKRAHRNTKAALR
jgi:predicted DsbA family dithiol-disulfide isomerase